MGEQNLPSVPAWVEHAFEVSSDQVDVPPSHVRVLVDAFAAGNGGVLDWRKPTDDEVDRLGCRYGGGGGARACHNKPIAAMLRRGRTWWAYCNAGHLYGREVDALGRLAEERLLPIEQLPQRLGG